MKCLQYIFQNGEWDSEPETSYETDWLLVFGARDTFKDHDTQALIKEMFPNAHVMGCSTSGEISGKSLLDDSLVVTSVSLSDTAISSAHVSIDDYSDSLSAGKALANKIDHENLRYALVISNGHSVNGTELVQGLKEILPRNVIITGGLAGDGDRFESTMVWHNETIDQGLIVIAGLYGEHIHIGHGSVGGWTSFGPLRQITQSKSNVLFQLDNQNALELYKSYLGEHADNLPASALLFPLAISDSETSEPVVRTILSIDDDKNSMTFAGDMPEGWYAKLMTANMERIIDGSQEAAENSLQPLQSFKPTLSILISCIGRRMILGQRAEEELEEAAETIGEQSVIAGFYSYGEISPLVSSTDCRLHNQTMTITTFYESTDA